ncbi:MAG: protein kinase [Bdellovibrionales bacterium]|nr:protein kinase [Bdellovibrionales bacterium]
MSMPYETFGKYVLLEKLATGGMAEVFLARGTGAGGIGKFFAIKRILPQYADSPEFIDMFKDEAKIAINLNHSNIVSIHEFGVEKGQFFLVMDYVEGRNLRQILNKMKKSGLQFSIDQICYMIKEVAAGLDHAHRCIDGSTGKPLNITHRDMSPQNVMVSFEGEVKIVDFGIAKAESQLENTRAGTLKGKFGYMSPEQAEGQPVDLRTDIFSLGIVLWELLANDRLFVANNEINTLRKIRDCQIPSLRKINPNIHSELERMVQKGLARDRNLRYQTGAALHRDMNRFLNRQYPDFSPHDFAVFIKSVFADEILSLRKRLMDYAKVNLNVSMNTPTRIISSEETSLVDANTNSLVQTETDSKPPRDGYPREYIVPEGSRTGAMSTAITHDKTAQTDSSAIALDISNLSRQPDTADEPTQNILPSSPQHKPSKTGTNPILDERALMAESERDISVSAKIQPLNVRGSSEPVETEEVSAPGFKVERRAPRHADYTESTTETNKPARFATFLVFGLICISVYAYLVKYFTPSMTDVIRVTDPVLHDFHTALGVDMTRSVASGSSNSNPSQIPIQPGQPAPAVNMQPAPTRADADQSGLVVTSNPSGAEIFLNGQSTGMVTPTRIEVPPQNTFTVTVRKRGYHDFKRNDVTRESVGHRLDATLQKLNVGWLDVEIFPPQDALLYVGGKLIPIYRNAAREIMIPGNTAVKVRAESRSKPTYDETTVSIPSDGRRAIKLNPRKMSRVPSSN